MDGLGGMAGKPAQGVSLEAALGKNIPDGFDLPRSTGDRSDTAILRVRLHESVDAMLIRSFAGGNGVPQHGGKNRTQSCQVSHYPMIDKVIESGHQALVEKWIDHFPVGRIPADQENLLGEGFRHEFIVSSDTCGLGSP